MARPEKVRLGEILLRQGLLTEDQLRQSLEDQKRTGRRLGRVFIDAGFVTEESLCAALARQLKLAFVDLRQAALKTELLAKLPESQARRFRAIVLEDRRDGYLVGMADPSDLFAYDELTRALRRDVDTAVVSESLLLQTIDRIYRRTEEISGLARELQRDIGEEYVDFGALGAGLGAEDAPVVKLLQSVFEDAVQRQRLGRAHRAARGPRADPLSHRRRADAADRAPIRASPAGHRAAPEAYGGSGHFREAPAAGRSLSNVIVRDQPIDVRMSTMPDAVRRVGGAAPAQPQASRRRLRLDALGMPDADAASASRS
jgi:MSHA biogenesis protein MshE